MILHEIEIQQGAYVLDAGCGTGALLNKVANISKINAYGVDTEKNMIDIAKNNHPQIDSRLARCDDTPFENQTFDIVITCMAYHHFSDKEKFAQEATRILKPNGELYIADPRFPGIVRKPINTILRCLKIAGESCSPKDILRNFESYRFKAYGAAFDWYAQIVKLKLSQPTNPAA